MGRAGAAIEVASKLEEAEALWYDLRRWPAFIDGFGAVVRDEGWPRADGVLVWDSTPAGRGRVIERVIAQVPGQGQTAEVEDPRLAGTQTVAFTARDEGVGISLALEYRLKGGPAPLRPVLDALFIGRAIRDSLRRTLTRFERELYTDRDHG